MNTEEKVWCKTHPHAYWGVDQFGNWYDQCSTGFRKKQRGIEEICEMQIVESSE